MHLQSRCNKILWQITIFLLRNSNFAQVATKRTHIWIKRLLRMKFWRERRITKRRLINLNREKPPSLTKECKESKIRETSSIRSIKPNKILNIVLLLAPRKDSWSETSPFRIFLVWKTCSWQKMTRVGFCWIRVNPSSMVAWINKISTRNLKTISISPCLSLNKKVGISRPNHRWPIWITTSPWM